MKEQSVNKYINHISGLPIRIPPYLRCGLRTGSLKALTQIEMIKEDPYVGKRNPEDLLPINLEENIRLRKIAWKASGELASYAESWKIQRYLVIVHGSLAKGLVRNPSNQDPSDIDIDLIIDDVTISKETRKSVRENMYQFSSLVGARLDSYVWNTKELRKSVGEYARYYLRAAAYPIVNMGSLWEEVLWVGIESQCFLRLSPHSRKKLRKILPMITQGQCAQAVNRIDTKTSLGQEIRQYLETQNLLEGAQSCERAKKLCELL